VLALFAWMGRITPKRPLLPEETGSKSFICSFSTPSTTTDLLLTSTYDLSFIWDVYDAILYQSAGFIVHGLACLAIFAFSFVSFEVGQGRVPSWGEQVD